MLTSQNRSITPEATATTVLMPRLRTILGRIIAPGEAGYDEARAGYYGGFDRHPAVIIQAADATDVSYTVTLARETGVPLAIRSGGHSLAGHSVAEGGIVLDLSAMRTVDVDPVHRTAWAETGVTAVVYTTAVGVDGLATGFGDSGEVGVGGITLGGGMGFLSRKFGLTIDSLVAAELVTADGQLMRVDAQTHPDLFWGIRGGGGNLAVATRFQFRLHEVGEVLGGMLILPATPEVIQRFVGVAEAAPDELTVIANIMKAPPAPFVPKEEVGRLVLMALLVYAGTPDEGARAIAPAGSGAGGCGHDPAHALPRDIQVDPGHPASQSGCGAVDVCGSN